jgi:hypothetical protein
MPLSRWEIVREEIIANRQEELQRLCESKKEFDSDLTKRPKVKKENNKQAQSNQVALRRSSRNRVKIDYKEDNVKGSRCWNV